jgi:hypothetical protein
MKSWTDSTPAWERGQMSPLPIDGDHYFVIKQLVGSPSALIKFALVGSLFQA